MTQIKALLAGWRKQYVIFMGKPMFELEPDLPILTPTRHPGRRCALCGKRVGRHDHYRVKWVEHVDCENPKLEKPQ